MPLCVPVSPEAYKLFHYGAQALGVIESNGVRVDVPYLEHAVQTAEADVAARLNALTTQPEYTAGLRRYGPTFKVSSPDQLKHVLYGDMGYKPTTPDGAPVTNVDEYALQQMGTPFTLGLLAVRKIEKLISTYLKAMLSSQCDGYVHCFFNLDKVITYRSSSDDPNLQNIPNRNKLLAALIRKAFIPRSPRHRIMEFDLKGAEVCVSACYHHDPNMVAYLKNPASDMHRDVAKRLFFIDQVHKDVRQAVKGDFTFSAFYGNWYRAMCQGLWESVPELVTMQGVPMAQHLAQHGITGLGACNARNPTPGTFEHHTQQVEKWFWSEMFARYAQWKDEWWNAYLNNGGFQTLTGFRISGVIDKKDATNYPIQGSAFHCILWAIVGLQQWLDANGMQTKIISTIHDSIVADVHEDEIDAVARKVHTLLTQDLPRAWPWLCVPITAEMELAPAGKSWFEKAHYELAI
jgi:DNA polymerase-1